MTPKKFESLMKLVRHKQATDENKVFWYGYQRGLRRFYHGEQFGTEEEHQKLLQLINTKTKSRREFGRGYREGFYSESSKLSMFYDIFFGSND